MGHGAGEDRGHPPGPGQGLDAGPLGAVPDHEERGAVEPGDRIDRLLDGVEAPEAAEPADKNRPSSPSSRRRNEGSRPVANSSMSTPVGGDQDLRLGRADPDDLLGNRVGATSDEIGRLERGPLAVLLEPSTPSGPGRAPLLRLPHARRRHEQDRRHPQRRRKLDARVLEQLVALPDEVHPAGRPGSSRVDPEAARPAPAAQILHCRLHRCRYPLADRRRWIAAELGRRAELLYVFRAHDPTRAGDPCRAEDPSCRGGPPASAHEAATGPCWPLFVSVRTKIASDTGTEGSRRPFGHCVRDADDGLPSFRMPSPKIRILHLVARSQRRGAEVVAVELAAELEQQGFGNRVVALGPGTDGSHLPDLVPLAKSKTMGALDMVRRVPKVRRLLADDPVDVVVAHGGWAAQVAALAVPRHGPVLVWQRIGTLPASVWRQPRTWWWQRIVRRFDAAIALTTDLEHELRRLGFAGPVWIIPNSRSPERFLDLDRKRAATRLRADVGAESGVPFIGFVGHLDRNKRPELAVDVLEGVLARGGSAHLVVAGDGLLRPELEADVHDRGLSRSVTFLGHRGDVEQVLAATELLLITSDSEGVPGVAIEALMAGCPVVTYPVGGVAEVVEDGVTGLVLERSDPELMAEAVAELLGDTTTREAMSAAGRLQTSRFSAAAAAEVFADHLIAVIDAR